MNGKGELYSISFQLHPVRLQANAYNKQQTDKMTNDFDTKQMYGPEHDLEYLVLAFG